MRFKIFGLSCSVLAWDCCPRSKLHRRVAARVAVEDAVETGVRPVAKSSSPGLIHAMESPNTTRYRTPLL